MKKEVERQKEKALFEGMTSLRAVLWAMENGASDRRVVRVLLDREREKKNAPEYSLVRAMGKAHGFEVEETDPANIYALAVGTVVVETVAGIVILIKAEPLIDIILELGNILDGLINTKVI